MKGRVRSHAVAVRRGTTLAVLAIVLAVVGCGGDDGGHAETTATATAPTRTADTTAASGRVLEVPSSYPTIQRAVDASRPGDLVLVAPGVYREAVEVTDEHPGIVIRGLDRNRVVLDGEDRRSDGIRISAPGVAVENLTVRRYAVNGVVWFTDGAYAAQGRYTQGWRGSYLTAYDNGLYGVYAFGVQHGRFDNVYASGHPDSGIYIGRCKPCNALVTDSTTELNHVGLEFTNAGGDVVVRDNVTRRNRVGIQVNSLTKERSAPQVGMTIERNEVTDNQAADAPRGSEGFGAGIVINGGRENVIRDNRVSDHDSVGIAVVDNETYTAEGNRVERNRLAGNRVDIVLQTAGASGGNCFAGNRPRSSSPARLERTTSCGDSVTVSAGRVPPLRSPPQVDYRRVPAPPRQPTMPRARTAPAQPADGRPETAR
ncbi:right-handed parallel beta-helix repeat-containing protein [Conexibacter stalactiti]|uniref:Right-handed parallel beta-helix repeat-containing protein n=1 Tax=Conexibacter stalactiti TaxID=1940611 RepID=A0ABU4HKK4_9ACTN|nr:right-handed parallel beta-helix repeat-containing protein [Conexibacter stalactiti]MDW5593831.1 right-handed parallel beta-helix repeat-containing protein [Conexibacter stalactiti]MEC5034473.1 right-handed parallel beta-helix repeat-containing protein [Conexibacter stalactiti]